MDEEETTATKHDVNTLLSTVLDCFSRGCPFVIAIMPPTDDTGPGDKPILMASPGVTIEDMAEFFQAGLDRAREVARIQVQGLPC